jgi:hypothetical protein
MKTKRQRRHQLAHGLPRPQPHGPVTVQFSAQEIRHLDANRHRRRHPFKIHAQVDRPARPPGVFNADGLTYWTPATEQLFGQRRVRT